MKGLGLKNLELKAYRRSDYGNDFLKPHFIEVLHQTDTYYKTTNGRLKLREETGKEAYAIRYDRTNEASERTCVYDCYPIPNADLFKQVFGGALVQEIQVRKDRSLYLYKNARIHIDSVYGLDTLFIEIEVVFRTHESASALMEELLKVLDIKPEDKLSLGYRELLLAKQ
jgi:adenylate cyclase, class 2